jgi:hypothetical protein
VPETEVDSPILPTQRDADWNSILDCRPFAATVAIGFTGIHPMIAAKSTIAEAAFTIP